MHHANSSGGIMRNRTLYFALRIIFWIYCSISMIFGLLMLVSNLQSNEADADATVGSFGLVILSFVLILLPLAVYFTVKSVMSYQGMNSKYGLPDSPTRTFFLIGGSVFLLICMGVTIAIYIVVLNSPT